MIPSYPGQAYKIENLPWSFLVSPQCPFCKQELPVIPGAEVSAQVFHVNSSGAWLDCVGIKSSTHLTEELSVVDFFLKL